MIRLVTAGLCLLLVAAFSGLLTPPGNPEGGSEAPAPEVRKEIRLQAATFDPLELKGGEAPLPSGQRGLYLVQFKGVITDEAHAALRAAGVETGPYVAEHAFTVRMTAPQAKTLTEHPLVRAVVRYRPDWKRAPALKETGVLLLSVRPFPGRAEAAGEALRALGASGLREENGTLVAELHASRVRELLMSEEVLFVTESTPSEPLSIGL